MKKYFESFLVLFVLNITLVSLDIQAQTLKGRIVGPYKDTPIAGALVTANSSATVARTDSLGQFSIELSDNDTELEIWSDNYFNKTVEVLDKEEISVILIPRSKFGYNDEKIRPFRDLGYKGITTTNSANINESNFSPAAETVEKAINNSFAGLMVKNKSGIPSEGAYLNFRGIQSLQGSNAPLIILNGVPYLPDMNESPIINGYSKSIFNALNVSDIENITFLKGPEASLYGSLGSNGVLLIDTEKATDLETVVEFSGQYGIAVNNNEYPVLNVNDFNRYLGDLGLTAYNDVGDMLDRFPFLIDDPNFYFQFLYNNNTNWQSEIYDPAFVTDNSIKIKGGDAVAKYNISVNYLNKEGTLKNTGTQRWNTQLNANIVLGKKISMFTTAGFAYINSQLSEQGMTNETNPLLAALYKAPILNPYRKDDFNNELPGFDPVRQFNVSNPLALVNDPTIMGSELYDFNFNTGINFNITRQLKLTTTFGLYYNYNRENFFLPGLSTGTILPLQDGFAKNTVRAGIGEAVNYYGNVNLQYSKEFGNNKLNTSLGIQSLITRQEYDGAQGFNTANDNYRTMDYVTEGEEFFGYIDEWNWANMYAHADYTFNNLVTASANVSYDASSSTGEDATRWAIFPSGGLTWYVKNMDFLSESLFINKLNIRAEYGLSGNGRFSNRTSEYFYVAEKFRDLSGIVRGNIPNTELKWETSTTFDAGIELAMLKNRFRVDASYYNTVTTDVILPTIISPEFGIESVLYNQGEISNKGIELALYVDIIQTSDFAFTLGGTLCMNENTLESIGGGATEIIQEFDDGSAVISRVGESVYSFYGYESGGVIASDAAANETPVYDYKGDQFMGGDIRFVDSFGDDGVIDQRDRTVIGSADPDMFGGLMANLRFKNLELTANLSYSMGNDMYNAVRRSMESMSTYHNQSMAVNRRWTTPGQITDMPRAVYGDPMKNNRFSDRWIEDASYLRLQSLVLKYTIPENLFSFAQGGVIYLAGENLITFTEYLGLDPVTSYSYNPIYQGFDYGKLPLPTTVKLGFNLQF